MRRSGVAALLAIVLAAFAASCQPNTQAPQAPAAAPEAAPPPAAAPAPDAGQTPAGTPAPAPEGDTGSVIPCNE